MELSVSSRGRKIIENARSPPAIVDLDKLDILAGSDVEPDVIS